MDFKVIIVLLGLGLCEVVKGASPVAVNDCPPTWLRSSGPGECHKFWPNSKKTWFDARETCKKLNADLLKLESRAEKEGVITEVSKYPPDLEWWIGLKRHGVDDSKWVWVDGETRNDSTKFILWGSGEPNNHMKSEDCAEIWDKLLNDKHCDTPLQFVCEQPSDTPRFCDMADGWHDIYPGKNCYKVFDQTKSAQDATDVCEKNGATLLSISDDEEQSIFSDHVTELNASVWINLVAKERNKDVFDWIWADTRVEVSNSPYWIEGVPSGQSVTANQTLCVKMSPGTKQFKPYQTWEPSKCDEQNRFICEKKLITCPPSYNQFTISNCLKADFSDSLLTWNEARGHCNLRGTSLLEIHSRYEMEQFNKVILTMLGDDFVRSDLKIWIGIVVDGANVAWDSGEPVGDLESRMLQKGGATNTSIGCAYLQLPDCSGRQHGCDETKFDWKVGPCNDYQVPVCTVPGDTAVKDAPPGKASYVCPHQFELIENACVRRHYGDPMDWFSARLLCQMDGAELASVDSAAKMNFLKEKSDGTMWIGLNDLQTEGNYYWSDETTNYGGEMDDMLTTNNYAIGDVYSENCIAFVKDDKVGKWLDFPCSAKNTFFCQIWAEWNIALGKRARQSSNYQGIYTADLAIDSCAKLNHQSGCCTHTQADGSPWWELDLGTVYPVRKVIIYRRYQDSCAACKMRMHNFRLFISNTTDTVENPVFQDRRAEPPAMIILDLPEIHHGRYVRIDVPDSRFALSLCEVQVFSEDLNKPRNNRVMLEAYSNCFADSRKWKGTVRHTVSGRACQEWVLNTPHEHTRHSDAMFIDGSQKEASNYCRDPDGEGRPWCYTTDPSVRWEYCPVPPCNTLVNKTYEWKDDGANQLPIGFQESIDECGSPNWMGVGTGVCYQMKGPYTHADAETFCTAIDGHVTIPESQQDLALLFDMFVNKSLSEETFIWFGLSYSTVSKTWRVMDPDADLSFVKGQINTKDIEANHQGTICLGIQLNIQPQKVSVRNCLERQRFFCKRKGKYVKIFVKPNSEVQIWDDPRLHLKGNTAIRFDYRGNSGARIRLGNTAIKSQTPVEITIGQDGNTRSTLVTKYTAENGFPAPINVSKFSAFWVSWAHGRIQVGEGSTVGQNIFLTGTIRGFAGLNYLSLSASESDHGLWRFPRAGYESSKRENLALKKTTWQSSTYSELGTSNRAVDGCVKSTYNTGCCIHTANELKPWWEVDLGAVYSIGEIVMTKRWDCEACRSRLNQFFVHISTTRISVSAITDNTIRYSRHDVEAAPVVTIQTPGAKGRYVLIQAPDKQVLEFCELEIYKDMNVICPRGWVNYDRQQCMFFGTDLVNWTTARQWCKAKDSDLAMLSSLEQELFTYETALNLQRPLKFNRFWFGLKSVEQGVVTWLDGSLTNYTRLPSNADQKKDYAGECFTTSYDSPDTGNWTQEDCSTRLYYICSKAIEEPLTTTTVPTTTTSATTTPTIMTTPLPGLGSTDSPPVTKEPTMKPTTTVGKIMTTLSKDACPSGWNVNPVTSSCILINRTQEFNFLTSELECLKLQSRLATITSADEQSYYFSMLFEHIAKEGKFNSRWAGFWFGGVDFHDEGSWKWHLSDDPWFDGINWSPGQPDNHNGKEDCVMIRTSLNNLGEINDAPCGLTRDGYVCKREIGGPFCADGWFYDERTKNCYLVNEDPNTWSGARFFCTTSHNADLASIRSANEQEFIGTILRADRPSVQLYWVGAKTDPKDDTWWWADKSPWWMRVAWDDAVVDPNKECGVVSSTKSLTDKALLKNENCQVKLPFICKQRAFIPGQPTTPAMVSNPPSIAVTSTTTTTASNRPTATAADGVAQPCGEGWEKRPNSRYCYKFGVDVQGWLKAEDICGQSGGTLLSITSNEEQHYIAGRLNGMQELPLHMWIGANDRSGEGDWKWVDGASFAFFNWKSGEPNDNNNNEDCASIITARDRIYGENFGLWNDMNCDSPQGYICKKPAQELTTTLQTTVTLPAGVQYGCTGRGWIEDAQHSCYLFVQDDVSWKVASTECRLQGGDLASIANELEQDFIFSQLPQDMYCFDIWENKTECSGWAARGECTRNPIWMHTHCHKACNACMHNCNDRYESSAKCLEWANSGECDINPKWMRVNCAASCGICKGAPTRGFWLGMYSARRSHQYEWSDVTDVTFTNWDVTVRQPEYFAYAAGSCVGMFLQTGTWNDGPCEDTLQGYVCKKPKQRLTDTTLSPFQIGCTGENSHGYEAFCYTYVKDRKTFGDAQKYCAANSGHLAYIQNRYVQSFVSSELVNLLQDYWIGLTFTNKEIAWTNHTKPPKFINFAKSFNMSAGEDYCFALTTYKPVGLWKEHSCTEKLPFVCQSPREGFTTPYPTTPTTTPNGGSCFPDWKEFKGNCYYFPDTEADFYTARAACRHFSANIVSIENQEENLFVVRNMLDRTWLGLTDLSSEGTFMWLDGKPVIYTHWNDGEPNNAGNEDCVHILFNAMWNDVQCHTTRRFVCKIPKDKQLEIIPITTPASTFWTPVRTTTVPDLCGEGSWTYFNGFCYKVFENRESWHGTVQFCKDNGGNLVSIHSTEEQAFVYGLMLTKDDVVWIGFNDLDIDGIFRWNDGTPTDFNPLWLPGQPNDGGGGEKCAAMAPVDNGLWHDYPCYAVKYVMCRRPQGTPTTAVIPTTPRPGGCQPGFREYGDRCFYFGGLDGSQLNTWSGAQDECQRKHAILASIHSLAENAFITSFFHDSIAKSFWIGLNDLLHENGNYYWADNSLVEFVNWAPNEPSSGRRYYNKELCVEMLGNEEKVGLWNDVACSVRKAFVCVAYKDVNFLTNTTNNCPPGYQPYQDSCYKLQTESLSWDSCQAKCSLDGGHLVAIDNVYEKAFVESLYTDGSEMVWVGMKLHKYGEDKWITGESQTMVELRQVMRTNPIGCLGIENFSWKVDKCYQNHAGVCEIPKVVAPQRTTPGVEKICSNRDLFLYDNNCYYVSTDLALFGSVQAKCAERNMEFVSIHSYKENEELAKMVNETAHKSNFGIRGFYIGMSFENNRDHFPKWLDHSAVNYLHIESVFYDIIKLNANQTFCFVYDLTRSDISTWRTASCDHRQGYICKMKADAPQTTVTTTTTTSTTTTTTPTTTTTTTTTPSTTTTTTTQSTTTEATTTQAPLKRRAPYSLEEKDEGLSPSQVAAIAVGGMACALVLVLLIYAVRSGYISKYLYKVQNRPTSPSIGFDNALFSKGDEPQNESVNFD